MKKSDPNNSPGSLVLSDQAGVPTKSAGHGIAERMVVDLLDLARRSSAKHHRKKVRLGSVDLREPDYAQIVNWAERLGHDPTWLLNYIMSYRDFEGNMSRIVDGALVELVWNGDLPLERFRWEDGLQLAKLSITNRMPAEYAMDRLFSLRSLTASGLGLSEIDLSPFPALEVLRCTENLLSHINLAATPKLIHLDCSGNRLLYLDLSHVPNLKVLDCAANVLKQLILNSALQLEEVCCSFNEISNLDVTKNVSVVSLDCESNFLESLHLPLHNRLKRLVCGNNSLQNLELIGSDVLETLWCERNCFKEINLGPCPALQEVRLYPDQSQPFHLKGLWELAQNWSKERGASRLEITVDNAEGVLNKRYWWTDGPLSYSDVCLCVLHEIKIVYEWA